MKRFAAIVSGLILALSSGAAAQTCGLYYEPGIEDDLDGEELLGVDYYRVFAGGGVDLTTCGLSMWRGADPFGFVPPAPNLTLTITELEPYDLQFRTVSNCDTTLLVSGANSEWYFDDDSGELFGSSLTVNPADNGRYDVWVGMIGNDTLLCETMVVAETFFR